MLFKYIWEYKMKDKEPLVKLFIIKGVYACNEELKHGKLY